MVSGGSHFRYSDEVRNLVLIQLAAGVRPTDIANALGVSKPFISQVKARSVVDPELLKNSALPKGRPPKVGPHAIEAIKDLIQQNPEIERVEVRDVLKRQFDIDVHVTTIGRMIQKLKKAEEEGLYEMPESSETGAARSSAAQQVDHINATSKKTPDTTRATRKTRKRKANQTN